MRSRKSVNNKPTIKNSKRAKFNAKEYLSKNVINKEGKAVIPILLKNKEEMFNKHDPRGMTLSTDIREYIDEIAYDIPYGYEIVFEINCKGLKESDKMLIERVIKLYYGLEINGIEFDYRISRKRSDTLYILGVISTILMFISVTRFDAIYLELLFIAVWYCLWEAVDETIYTQSNLKYDRMDAEQIYQSTVTFVDSRQKKNEED